MREIAQVTGEEYPHLYGVVYVLDGTVTAADELEPVRAEARAALETGGDRLGGHTRWLLERLKRAS